MNAVCAMGGLHLRCGCSDIPEGDCDCEGVNLMQLESVVETA